MRTRFKVAIGATTLAVALGLTGCTSAVENIIEQQTGAKVDVKDGGISVETKDGEVQLGVDTELPADFPKELPLPTGKLTSVVSAAMKCT